MPGNIGLVSRVSRTAAYRWIKRVLGAASLGFLIAYVVRGWSDAGAVLLAQPWPLVAVIVLQFAASLSLSMCWSAALPRVGRGCEIRRRFLIVQPAKYLPGGIAQPVAQVSSVTALGIKAREALGGYGVYLAMTMSAAIILSGGLIASGGSPNAIGMVIGVVALTYSVLILIPFSRGLMSGIVIWLALLVGSDGESDVPETVKTRSHSWALLALGAMAGAYYILGLSLAPDVPLLVGVGAFSTAWLAGFVALPFPAGIGVREIVLVALLATWMTPETAVSIALAHRVVQAVVEGLLSIGARLGSCRSLQSSTRG